MSWQNLEESLAQKMLPLLFLLGLGHASLLARSDLEAYMTYDMEPSLGPELDSVYQQGSPGGAWTDEEVDSTRMRVLQMIHPDWIVKQDMYRQDKSDTTKVW